MTSIIAQEHQGESVIVIQVTDIAVQWNELSIYVDNCYYNFKLSVNWTDFAI